MLATALLASALLTTPADTTVLVRARALLWKRRPQVAVVTGNAGEIRLTVTAREPLYFATTTLTLHLTPRDSAIAVLPSETSSIDARSNTNYHTLGYLVTPEQLRAWALGGLPTIRIGKINATLDAAGRQALATVAYPTPPSGN